jgi:hypothetical protein
VRRLPPIAFGVLVAATVAAFFVTQHLKVATPFLQGAPAPLPAAFDPVSGVRGQGEPRACWSRPAKGAVSRPVDYRSTYTTFYLQHQSGHVAVYIVNASGDVVRTIASDYDFPRTYVRNPPSAFRWNGRDDDGLLAPEGTYYYRVVLIGRGRTVTIEKPVRVITTPPRPVVTRVSPSLISPVASGAAPTPARAVIRYDAGAYAKSAQAIVFRTDLPGPPRQVFSFGVAAHGHRAVWNGLIRGRRAPAGTYLIGLHVLDQACQSGSFPVERVPVAGATPHAGLTVRYLAAEVPDAATPAGSPATVYVDSRRRPFRWALRRPPSTRVIARGAGAQYALRVPLPGSGPALYELAIRAGADRTVVPLVAAAPAGAAPRTILLVIPVLSWQGSDPVDDDGDGLPDTLVDDGEVPLDRPLVDGIPAGFADEAALLAALARAGFRYDLTTDVALAADPTPLRRHPGVVLAGSELWLPGTLRAALRSYVAGGGHVLSLGTGSLLRTVTVEPSAPVRPPPGGEPAIAGGVARNPTAATASDALGARIGPTVSTGPLPVLGYSDPLRLFGASGAFGSIRSYQAVHPPAGSSASVAGISQSLPAIAGFRSGRGVVVEAGLTDFGALAGRDPSLRTLLSRLWRLLGS